MRLPDSTYEILVEKYLNEPINSKWIDWSIEMLEHGFDTETLRIMAGMNEKENQFVLSQYAEILVKEFKLDPLDYLSNLRGYVGYLYQQSKSKKLSIQAVLRKLKNLHLENSCDDELGGFYLLYYAFDDLQNSDQQWYVNGANRENIESIIEDYFNQWFISEDKNIEILPPQRNKELNIWERLNIFSLFSKQK